MVRNSCPLLSWVWASTQLVTSPGCEWVLRCQHPLVLMGLELLPGSSLLLKFLDSSFQVKGTHCSAPHSPVQPASVVLSGWHLFIPAGSKYP